MILSKGGKYAVYSEDGTKKLSRWYSTKEKAVKRLRQIEYFKHNEINFTPPKSVQAAYRVGLNLHEKGNTGKGLEASTVAMARKLARGEKVSKEWARKANRFWGRNKRFLSLPKDSPGYASAMLWGGRPGMRWYAKLVRQMDALKTNKQEVTTTRKEQNPTGQAGRIRKAKADMKRRILSIEPQVRQMIESFPVRKVTINQVGYEYDIPPEQLESMFEELQILFYQALGLNIIQNWFFLEYIYPAYQEATLQSFTRMVTMAEGLGVVEEGQFQPEQFTVRQDYQKDQRSEATESFSNMKTYATEAASDITRAIITGAAAGASVASLLAAVRKRFTLIVGYKAERFASTEVERVYNDGRFFVQQFARDNLGLDLRVIHISALLLPIGERTRRSHAARHGNIYTPKQQQDWWNEGANRINCHCTTLEIIYVKGEMTQKNFIKKLRARKKQVLGVS